MGILKTKLGRGCEPFLAEKNYSLRAVLDNDSCQVGTIPSSIQIVRNADAGIVFGEMAVVAGDEQTAFGAGGGPDDGIRKAKAELFSQLDGLFSHARGKGMHLE